LSALAVLGALAVLTLLAGCGSSGGSQPDTESSSGTAVDAGTPPAEFRESFPRYAERAERICARSTRETHAVGREFSAAIASSGNPEEAITNGVVKPGIEILSREAAQLRALGPASESRTLEVLVGLFDPIVELARQRVQASGAAEPERARSLEVTIAELENEQHAAADALGLNACGVRFTSALGGSE
jgi:hypothetical protein